jgi:hypothetical protein
MPNRNMQASDSVSAAAVLTPIQNGPCVPRVGTNPTEDSALGMHVIVDVPEVVEALSAIGFAVNEQLAVPPAGAWMLADKATLPANPPVPVTVTVVTACPVEGMLIVAGFALRLYDPPPPELPVIVRVAGAVVELELKLGSPL